MRARLDPDIVHVERFQWLDAEWRDMAGHGATPVTVAGVDTSSAGLLFAGAIPLTLRARLAEPDSALVDAADLDKLSLTREGYGRINGHRVKVLASVHGIRALGAVNVTTSLATARALGAPGENARWATYVLARVRDPSRIAQVRERLQSEAGGRYTVWTRTEFSRRSMLFWLFDTGAGLGFVFAALIVIAVGIIITSQTLIGALAGSLREFAMLRALGVSQNDLRQVVLVQSTVLGGVGLLVAAVLSAVVVMLARWGSVPAILTPAILVGGLALIMLVALVSGAAAARSVSRADPIALLR
jgi:putative ABC transport system permease protein